MVKLLFTPKGIEGQFVKRVKQQEYDQGLVAAIMKPPEGARHVNVVLCQDGRGPWWSTDSALALNLQNLFNLWSPAWGHDTPVEVHIVPFSFYADDVETMLQVLIEAGIFYMAGIFEVNPLWIERTRPGGSTHRLLQALREQVQ